MPDWSQPIRARLRGLNLEGARESEIVEELSEHLDDSYRDLLRSGSSEKEARRLALEELETHDLLAQELRNTQTPLGREPVSLGANRGGNFMASFWHDIKVAARMIRTKPGFSALVIAMLALGVAGNAAIFSIFNGLFLRPLPFAEPGRLMDIDETAPKWKLRYVGVSNPDYFNWEKNNTTFSSMAAFDDDGRNLADDSGNAQRIRVSTVTQRMMEVLGIKPLIGRNFLPEEDRKGGAKVVLLGYDLWRRLFQSDRNVSGRIVKLSEQPYQVIGVLPPDAVIPADADAWIPLAADPAQGGSYYLQSIGRLKPGVTLEQARADLLRVHLTDPANGHTVADSVTTPIVQPYRDRELGDFKPVTRILLGGVGLVLLIACVNVAGLMLVRGEARSREIAIRAAVGASRGYIVRQLLTENFLLAGIGGVFGVLGGYLGMRALTSMMPDTIPHWVRFDLDWRFALFAVAVTGAAAILFGLAPALDAAAVDAGNCLREASRASLSRGKRTVLSALVVGEVALALMLLVSSGLLLQAFRKVTHTDPGFRTSNVITWSLRLPSVKYSKPETQFALLDSLLGRLRAMPGVVGASAASAIPLGGHQGYFYQAEGAPAPDPNAQNPVVLQVTALTGYLEAMGITTLAGRSFEDRDQDPKQPPVAVVNETFLKTFWPGARPADVIGRRIAYTGSKPTWNTVIGVTRDTKHYGLDVEMKPSVFVPFPVSPAGAISIVVRTANDTAAPVSAARQVLRELDRDLPMFEVKTMSESLTRSLWVRRAYSWLFVAFAASAILLAAAGIYGVVSFAVSQRTREIGIRMALGARPQQVMARVLGGGMVLVAAGVAAGIAGSLAIAQLLDSFLFGVSAHDAATYLAVIVLVAAVGALANYLPARRAARLDPMRALRAE